MLAVADNERRCDVLLGNRFQVVTDAKRQSEEERREGKTAHQIASIAPDKRALASEPDNEQERRFQTSSFYIVARAEVKKIYITNTQSEPVKKKQIHETSKRGKSVGER